MGEPIMIEKILLFWAAYKIKLAIYGLIALGILYGLRLYGNRQWAKGELRGRLTVTKDIERQKKAEWKAKESAIALAAQSIDAEKRSVLAATEALAQDRANLSRTLSDAQAALQRERIKAYANAANIGAADLDAAIRAISAELTTH